jgi:hypothetical protein
MTIQNEDKFVDIPIFNEKGDKVGTKKEKLSSIIERERSRKKPTKKTSIDIEQGWHPVFFKILHHPKGLKSLTESELQQFNKFIKYRVNETLWAGKRIVAIAGKKASDKETIEDDLRGQIILYLKGGQEKKHISVKKLLKLSPKQLFNKIDNHADNYLHYWYVGKPIREEELREQGKMFVGDSGQLREFKKEELKSMKIRREPAQEVTLSEVEGDVDDGLDSTEREALSQTAEDHKYLKGKKISKWAREALEASVHHRTISNIAKDKQISEEAAEILYEMDISARNMKRLIKRRRK